MWDLNETKRALEGLKEKWMENGERKQKKELLNRSAFSWALEVETGLNA